MSILHVHYTSDFADAYKKLSIEIKKAVDRKDKIFRQNPYHPGLQTHKLSGVFEGFWAFWVTKSYRVLFEFIKDGAIFYDVGTHDIYK